MSRKTAIEDQAHEHVWREPQFWLLLAMTLAIFVSRPTALTIRGEESRWARVAVEMLESGDFVTPRQQGVAFPDRPPLGSWLIALSMQLLGSHGALAVRLPAILATVLLSLLVYGYARSWQSAWGAWVAGSAFATCGQVLQLGGLGESEAVYALLLGGALLVWNWGYERNWHPAAYWIGGHSLMALATLTKGVQAPVYFVAGVGTYLLLRRDWRSLFSVWNFAGLAVAAFIIMAWVTPFAGSNGWADARQVLFGLSLNRMQDVPFWSLTKHAATFPWEFLGAMLPWSPLLLAYLRHEVRREVASRGGQAMFLTVCVGLALLSCMAAINARPRYVMPLIPLVAALIGATADLALGQLRLPAAEHLWKVFSRVMAVVMPLVGIGFLIGTYVLRSHVRQSAAVWATVGLLLAISWISAAVAWRSAAVNAKLPAWCAGLAVVVFLGWGYTAAATQWLIQDSPNTAQAVSLLRQQLPPDANLISLDSIHHPFAYHYDKTISIRPWPGDAASIDTDVEYFCFSHSREWELKSPPFPWEKLAEVPCDRSHRSKVGRVVIVGRRLDDSSAPDDTGTATEIRTSRKNP